MSISEPAKIENILYVQDKKYFFKKNNLNRYKNVFKYKILIQW